MQFPDLNYIASRLEALEETIIFVLIERIQFYYNPVCYLPGESGFPGEDGQSLFSLRLRGQEELDARFGRFRTPEERPVSRNLPSPERVRPEVDNGLLIDNLDRVNLSEKLRDAYLAVLPEICISGDDGHYGSSIERDVICIQALIRRVHFAAFYVAESKYRSDPEGYSALIKASDSAAIGDKLTRPEVEARILSRVHEKSRRLQEISDYSLRSPLDPEAVTGLYRDVIIPLTKEGEVQYLLCRG